jgi:hypothetical protein
VGVGDHGEGSLAIVRRRSLLPTIVLWALWLGSNWGAGFWVHGSGFGWGGAVTEAEEEEGCWRVWGGHEPRSSDHL